MSLQCDNLSGELQDQWSSSIVIHLKIILKEKTSALRRYQGHSDLLNTVIMYINKYT